MSKRTTFIRVTQQLNEVFSGGMHAASFLHFIMLKFCIYHIYIYM